MPSSPEEPGRAPDTGSPEEALRRLEQRLDQASEAAERLMAQAAAAAAARVAGDPAGGPGNTGNPPNPGNPANPGNPGNPGDPGDRATPPPSGWQPADEGERRATSELDPLVALVQAVRDLIPPDLQQRLIAAFREVLLALRALIDWYLDRLDRRRDQGVEVQDIPIL
jgi:hypothetical protein